MPAISDPLIDPVYLPLSYCFTVEKLRFRGVGVQPLELVFSLVYTKS